MAAIPKLTRRQRKAIRRRTYRAAVKPEQQTIEVQVDASQAYTALARLQQQVNRVTTGVDQLLKKLAKLAGRV